MISQTEVNLNRWGLFLADVSNHELKTVNLRSFALFPAYSGLGHSQRGSQPHSPAPPWWSYAVISYIIPPVMNLPLDLDLGSSWTYMKTSKTQQELLNELGSLA